MKKINIILLLFAMVPMLAKAQSELAKYQKKIKGYVLIANKPDADKLVTVTVAPNAVASPYTAPAPDPSKRNIYNLTEKGQKAFIEALNAKTTTTKDFLQALPTVLEPGKESGSPNPEVKMTDYLKKLEIDVSNHQSALNTGRIAQLLIWVTLDNTNVIELEGFNNLTTKYQSVDFGTLSLTRVHGFTLNAGINLGGTGSTSTNVADVNGGTTTTNANGGTSTNTSNLGATYNSTRTIAEQIAIKNSVITMKGSLGRGEASLLQNGVPNQDLSDNINLELVVRSVNNETHPYVTFKGLFDSNNQPVTAVAGMSVTKGYFTTPQPIAAPVTARISYTFVYRDVVSGQNTVMEGDDKIYLRSLTDRVITSTPFTLLNPSELRPKIYHVASFTGGIVPPSPDVLYLNYYGEHIELLFSDLSSPSDLINWLRLTGQTAIKGFNLEIGRVPAGGGLIAYTPYTVATAANLHPVLR
jgi:hypothetical protein